MTRNELNQLTEQFLTAENEIRVSIPIEPMSTQHGSRIGKNRTGTKVWFYNDPVKEKYFKTIFDEVQHQLPTNKFEGPVSVEFDFYLENTKELLKRAERGAVPMWSLRGTDWDNFCKGTQDAFSKAGFWHNDSQIWYGIGRKWWAELDLYPRIECTITSYIYHEPTKTTRRIQRASESEETRKPAKDWRQMLPV